ncbi:MAG: hypothetical protein ACO31Z_00510 [Litorivicinaceae bacterium]
MIWSTSRVGWIQLIGCVRIKSLAVTATQLTIDVLGLKTSLIWRAEDTAVWILGPFVLISDRDARSCPLHLCLWGGTRIQRRRLRWLSAAQWDRT